MENSGSFKKGNKGKPKGAKNKNTLAKKEQLENLFNENGGFNALFASINEIEDPKDKAATLLKVMEFFMAKHKTVEHTGDEINQLAQVVFTSTGMKPVTSEKQMKDDNE